MPVTVSDLKTRKVTGMPGGILADAPDLGLPFRPFFRLTLISTTKRCESTMNKVAAQRHTLRQNSLVTTSPHQARHV